MTTLGLLALASGCGGEPPRVAGIARNAVIGASTLVQDGLRLDVAVEPVALRRVAGQQSAAVEAATAAADRLRRGEAARVTLQVTDAVSGQASTGLRLSAWLMPRPGEAQKTPDDKTTREIVRRLGSGSPDAGAATALNAWFLVTLNTDRTLTMVDPGGGMAQTRMRAVFELPCVGADLAFGDHRDLVFVSLPDRGEVWAIDTVDFSVRQRIAAGTAPRRLQADPEAGLVWAGDERGDRIYAIDGRSGLLRGSVAIGAGDKLLAVVPGGSHAFAVAADTGTVLRIDTRDLSATPVLTATAPVTGLVWSAAAGEVLACQGNDGVLIAVQARSGRRRELPALPAGSGPLWTTRDGRWLFAVNTAADTVHVQDLATGQPARRVATAARPDHVVCTDAFAHIHCAGSRELTSIQLATLADGGAVPTMRIPIGQQDPRAPASPRGGALLAAAPDGVSVLVAAPEEKVVYCYAEGMNAAMGSLQNHSRVPVAMGVLDRSLRGAADGSYTTVVPLEHHGKVDLYVHLAKPTQLFARFELQVEPDAATLRDVERKRPQARIEAVVPAAVLPVGRDAVYRFRLLDPATGAPIPGRDDVRILAHGRFGNWQRRLPASPDGDVYLVTLKLPTRGDYRMQVQSAGLNLAFSEQRPLEFKASDDVEGAVPPPAAADPTATRR